jgi:zinc transport system ATP-binding protein
MDAPARNALVVEHLSVSFGGGDVLHDLSFSVPLGSTLAIIGPNGAGKTVLFRALVGSIPSRGRISWAPGTKIGYVPQKLDIERELPLRGTDFLRAKAGISRAGPGEIDRALALVELAPEVASRPIGALSGGQFQRLLLASALMGRPTVLLFDEPTAGVDEVAEVALYAAIRKLQREERMTLLLISHELNLVNQYATRVLCLGRSAPCFGPPQEILNPETISAAWGAPVKYHRHE